ncbi:MAG TPA: hypothetical protein VGG33_08980 [Polyangia bacterium]
MEFEQKQRLSSFGLLENSRGSGVVEKIVIVAIFVLPLAVGVARLAGSTNAALTCQGQRILKPDGTSICAPAVGAAAPSVPRSSSGSQAQSQNGGSNLLPDRSVDVTPQGTLQFQGENAMAPGPSGSQGGAPAAIDDWDILTGLRPVHGQRVSSPEDWALRRMFPMDFRYAGAAPNIDEMLSDPAVQQALDDAWGRRIPGQEREHGGWIYLNTQTRRLETRDQTAGGQAEIDLWNHPIAPHLRLVGVFHIHPNSGPNWVQGPSPQDGRIDFLRGVPDIVRAENGFYLSGPEAHEAWAQRDAPRTHAEAQQLLSGDLDALTGSLNPPLPPPGLTGPPLLPPTGPTVTLAPPAPAPNPPGRVPAQRPSHRFEPYRNPARPNLPPPLPGNVAGPSAPQPNVPMPPSAPAYPQIEFAPVLVDRPPPPPRRRRTRTSAIEFAPVLVDRPPSPPRRRQTGNRRNRRPAPVVANDGRRWSPPQPPPGPSSGSGAAGPSGLQGQALRPDGVRNNPANTAPRRFEVQRQRSQIKFLTGTPPNPQ